MFEVETFFILAWVESVAIAEGEGLGDGGLLGLDFLDFAIMLSAIYEKEWKANVIICLKNLLKRKKKLYIVWRTTGKVVELEGDVRRETT